VSRIRTAIKGLFAAAVTAGALGLAAPAGAVTLLSATMDTSYTAYINGPAENVYAYIGPVTFHATDGGPAFDFTGYCVDIYHDMFLGPLNGGAGYDYHGEDLATDSLTSTPAAQSGTGLSAAQLKAISALLNYSVALEDAADADLHRKQAGIQGAIWSIENPLYTVTATDGAVQTYISTFKLAAGSSLPAGKFQTIFANDYGHQAFAYGTGVPEAGTWMLMIMGFGTMGAVLRRRRMVPVRVRA
jgi:hypothetical protein